MKTQKLLQILMSAGLTAMVLIPGAAGAAWGGEEAVEKTIDGVTYPYQHTFIISAYYSPIAGQKRYVTGSYAGDVRLNGEGVHAADGSLVYPGMIAAPKSYAFGTKMKIPGIGVVAVHDRGGAIVHAGERNQAHDRLDVWMGYGDQGLRRALNWGRRTVDVTVYGIDASVQENVYLEGYSEAEKVAETLTGDAPTTFVEDLSVNDKSDNVKKLQAGLKDLGYYNGEATGDYDDATKLGVIKLQIATGVIDDENDFGAGYFGPQTRKSFEDALNRKNDQVRKNLPVTPLSRDDQGDEVRKLQQALQKLGYDVEVNGIYDHQTVEAIFQFQKDQNVVQSKTDFGAGVFGPKTMKILASKLVDVSFDQANAEESSVQPVVVFSKDLRLGDKGEDVRKLQDELKRMNLLGVETSGYYGEVTQHAVMKFQQAQGLINAPDDADAGYFGPGTRARIHAIIGQRQHVNQLMADRNPPAKKEETVALQ